MPEVRLATTVARAMDPYLYIFDADYASVVREITGVLDKFPKPWQSSTLQLLCKIQPQFTEHMYTLAECVVHELLHFSADEARKSPSAIAVY